MSNDPVDGGTVTHADLADRLRLIANEMTYGRTASTHSDACWQWHESCALHRAADLLDGQPQDRPAQCSECGGYGRVVDAGPEADPCEANTVECFDCGGSGDTR